MTITPEQVLAAYEKAEGTPLGRTTPVFAATLLNAAIGVGLVFESMIGRGRQYLIVDVDTADRLARCAEKESSPPWSDIINAVLDDRERLQTEVLTRQASELTLQDDHIYYCKDGELIPVNTQPGFWSTNYLSDGDEGEPMTLGRYRQSTWQEKAGVASDAGPITPVETPPADQGVTFIGVLLDGGRTKDGWGWTGKEWVRDDSAPVDHSNDPEIVEQQDAEERNGLRKLGELQASDSKVMLSDLADLRGIVEYNGKILGDVHLEYSQRLHRLEESQTEQWDLTRSWARGLNDLKARLDRVELRLRGPEPGEGAFVGSGGAWGGPTITDQYGRIWPVVGGSVGYPNGGGGGGSNHWQGWTAGGPVPGDTTGDEHPGVS